MGEFVEPGYVTDPMSITCNHVSPSYRYRLKRGHGVYRVLLLHFIGSFLKTNVDLESLGMEIVDAALPTSRTKVNCRGNDSYHSVGNNTLALSTWESLSECTNWRKIYKS